MGKYLVSVLGQRLKGKSLGIHIDLGIFQPKKLGLGRTPLCMSLSGFILSQWQWAFSMMSANLVTMASDSFPLLYKRTFSILYISPLSYSHLPWYIHWGRAGYRFWTLGFILSSIIPGGKLKILQFLVMFHFPVSPTWLTWKCMFYIHSCANNALK